MPRKIGYPLPVILLMIWFIMVMAIPSLVPLDEYGLREVFGWGMLISFILLIILSRYAWEIKIKSYLVAKLWVYDNQKVVYEGQILIKTLDSMTFREYIELLNEYAEELKERMSEEEVREFEEDFKRLQRLMDEAGKQYITVLHPEKPVEYLGRRVEEIILVSSDALERLVPPHEAEVNYNDMYYTHRYVYYLPCQYLIDLRVENKHILILQLVIDDIEPSIAANLIAAKYRVELDRIKLELKRKDELVDVITREEVSVESMQRNFTDHLARAYQDLWRGLRDYGKKPFYKSPQMIIALALAAFVGIIVLDALGIIALPVGGGAGA